MNKTKIFKGKCPISGKNEEIAVRYIDASTREGKEYAKGTFYCQNKQISE